MFRTPLIDIYTEKRRRENNRVNFRTGGTYRDYVLRGDKYKDLTFEEWLQEDKPGYKPSEFAIGGRVGLKRGKQPITLTPQMIIDIAEDNPNFTATDILKKLQKNKTKNYVTSVGTPINRAIINKTLSQTFDLAAAEKSKVPKGYISSQEFFNTEGMPISKRDYMTVKNRNPSLLTNTIGENAVFVKRGEGGEGAFYFKKPTKKDLELYQRIASRKGQLKPNTINLMLEFDKRYGNLYNKGELPTLKKIQQSFPDITATTAGNVTARLSQWYNGSDFINPELKSIDRNKSLAAKIQKASSGTQYGNFYSDQAYKVALDTIDEKIGRQVGSFKAFKDNIKVALKEAGLPIYSKNSPYGFNLNEMAGVTGASRTKTAEFSDFVDIAEGNFNQKQLARFQKDFAAVREQLDKLDLANKPQNKNKAISIINDFKDVIKYYEKETGSELPKLGLGTADKYYSTEKLSDIGKERLVGETGKKKNRKIPGTDLLGSSQKSGYTVIIPENYRTVGQIMETGTRDVLKKNVQNTLEEMKKFFNEYDEKKMFQKLKNASPDVLKKMMKVIPKVVSLEDDFTNAYGYPLTAGLDSNIGVKPEEKNFIERNPITTGAAATAGVGFGTKTGRKALGKLLTAAGTPLGVLGITAGVGVDPTSAIDRVALGAEAALAPSLVKGANQLTKNALLRKLLSLGLTPAMAARYVSPLGIASLGGEALYQYGKFVKDELERIENMTPEEREAYNVEQEEQMGIAAADGGLITREAFKDGFDPKKRKTMKILGGLASIPVLGKYLKILGPLAPAATEAIQRSGDAVPTFLYDLIAKVKANGMKFFTGNRADEFEYVYEKDGYQVREQGNKITVRKRDEQGEMLEKDMEMELEVDPETGGLTYKEATARPDAEGKLKDVEEYIEDVDLEEMRKYTYDE